MELAAVFLFQLFRALHIAAGFAALLVFWIPIVVRKGGKAHVRVGWIYVWAMGVVSLSALYMGWWRIALDPAKDRESVAFAWFLIFIALLSSVSAWYGIRVLRFKQRKTSHRNWLDLLLSSALLIFGIGMSVYGFSIRFPLLSWFPFVGIILGSTQLWYWLRPPQTKMHWWFEHMGGLMGCCIATVTAFTVFGAPRLLGVSSVHPVVWFIPTIILGPAIGVFAAYYKKKFKPVSRQEKLTQ